MDMIRSGYEKRIKVAYVIGFILFLIISFFCGVAYGVQKTIREAVHIGFILLEKQKINITIDEQMIQNGIMQYKNNIGGCLFIDNSTAIK